MKPLLWFFKVQVMELGRVIAVGRGELLQCTVQIVRHNSHRSPVRQRVDADFRLWQVD